LALLVGSGRAQADMPYPGQSVRTSSQECIDTYRRTHTIGELVFNGLPASTGLKRLDVLTPAIQASDPFTALVAGQKYQMRQYAMASTYKIPGSDAVRGSQVSQSYASSYSESFTTQTVWSNGAVDFYVGFSHQSCSSNFKPGGFDLSFDDSVSGCGLSASFGRSSCSALGSQQLNLWIANPAIGTISDPPLPYVARDIDRSPNDDQRETIGDIGWTYNGGYLKKLATASDLANDAAADAFSDSLLTQVGEFAIKTNGDLAGDCSTDTGGACLTVEALEPGRGLMYEYANESYYSPYNPHVLSAVDSSFDDLWLGCGFEPTPVTTEVAYSSATNAVKIKMWMRMAAAAYRKHLEANINITALKAALIAGTGPIKSVTVSDICSYVDLTAE